MTVQRLPVLALTRRALAVTAHMGWPVVQSAGFLFMGFLAVALVATLVVGGVGIAVAALAGPEAANALSSLFGFAILAAFFVIAAHIFNVWGRVGALGPARFSLELDAAARRRALANGLRLLALSAVYLLIWLGLNQLLTALGLAIDFFDLFAALRQAIEQDTPVPPEMLAGSTGGEDILALVGQCLIFSLFSPALMRTALANEVSSDDKQEGPHTIDFAVVLLLLYGAHYAAFSIADALDFAALALAAYFGLGLFVMLATAVAHGLRYRFAQDGRLPGASDA